MQTTIEQQQSRFERLSAALETLSSEAGDSLSAEGRAALEEALTEAALGSEDAQIALDVAGDKAA